MYVSTVPKAKSPLFALALALGTLRKIHVIFGPEKYASGINPVLRRMYEKKPFDFNSLTIGAVLLHCHTIAL
jgi:hydrogenase maturation factor HypE